MVQHTFPNIKDLNPDDLLAAINAMFQLSDHAGIGEFRVGRFAVTILEMTHFVTFAEPMPDTGYEVFMLPLGNLGGQFWATNLTINGFTANFSSGANITFSYMAVEDT